MRAREFITEAVILESFKLARTEFSRAATAKFGPEAVAKIGTKDEPKEVTQAVDEVKKSLDEYRDLVSRNRFKKEAEKNINYWRDQGWDKFVSRIKQIKTDEENTKAKLITIQNSNDWNVIIPINKEASVTYGKNTSWCTTKPLQTNYEEYFYDKNVTLIYALHSSGNGHCAIASYPDGKTEYFNQKDFSITAQDFQDNTGIDPAELINFANSGNTKAMIDKARKEYKDAIIQFKSLLEETPLNHDEIERNLLFTKSSKQCYDYIIKYYETNNKQKVTVPDMILIPAVQSIPTNSTEGQNQIKLLGTAINFTTMRLAVFNTLLRGDTSYFVADNYDLLTPEQQKLTAGSPAYAYIHAINVSKGKYPEGEAIIATSPRYSVLYALNALDRQPFKAGEPAIATHAQYAFEYARYVLKGEFPAGEPEIATNIVYAYRYAVEAIKKEFPAGEDVIIADGNLSLRYAVNAVKGPFKKGESIIARKPDTASEYATKVLHNAFPAGEAAIAKDAESSYNYAKYALHSTFPAGEAAIAKDESILKKYQDEIVNGPWGKGIDGIASDAESAYEYAQHVLDKQPFPLGEPAIAKSAFKSLEYARMLNQPFPAGEHAIATSAKYSYEYANSVLRNKPFPAGEPAIATDTDLALNYARYVIQGQWKMGEDAIMKDFSNLNTYLLIAQNPIPKAESIIAKDARASYTYAKECLNGKRFSKGEDVIAKDITYAEAYARDIVKGEWKLGEDILATDPRVALNYARNISKKPFKLGEKVISRDPGALDLYKQFVEKYKENQPVAAGQATNSWSSATTTDKPVNLLKKFNREKDKLYYTHL